MCEVAKLNSSVLFEKKIIQLGTYEVFLLQRLSAIFRRQNHKHILSYLQLLLLYASEKSASSPTFGYYLL